MVQRTDVVGSDIGVGVTSRPYFSYWGKADPAFGSVHLAAFHCLDVAAVAECMLASDELLRVRLADWLRLNRDEVVPTVAALCALHDIGKLDARFQVKARDQGVRLDPARAVVPSDGYDHGGEGFRHLRRELRAVIDEQLGEDVWPLLQAVTGHHGSLPSFAAQSYGTSFLAPAFKPIRARDREARAALVSDVVDLFRRRGASFPLQGEPSGALVTVLAGLCSVADWIGSQPEHFPYHHQPLQLARYYEERAIRGASAALDAIQLRGGRPSGAAFDALFPGYRPRDVQAVTEAMMVSEGPALVIIEAQMGSGKTEAALSLANRMLANGAASGVFIGLPTMATSNAMFERLERVAPRMFGGEVNLVLAHGRRLLHKGFERLLETNGIEPYADDARVVCNRWLAGRKRALLGQLGVGTVDQAMQAAIRVRHHFVRAFGLARSVVLLDEIHAYDAYMEVILERLVEWLGALGAPVVLLSATLPEQRRIGFAEAYARGAGWNGLAAKPERNPIDAPYPLVTALDRNGLRELAPAEAPVSRVVRVRRIATSTPEADVPPKLIEAVNKGATVCWIRNTVTEAQAAWDAACALGLEPVLFHARMRGRDRQRIEEQVLREFGSKRAVKGQLLIATQVVEQSLDLDFDWLVTDLCPIDLLLQRIGRLQRHRRARPCGFEVPELVVVTPVDEDIRRLAFGRSSHVYDPATLWLTLDLVQRHAEIALPSDIRRLVELVYDPALRREQIRTAELSDRLREAEAKLEADLEARRQNAKRACIPPTSLDPGSIEDLDDQDETVQALTRDGDSVTLLPVLWDGEAGRSLEGEDAWDLDPDSPHAWQTARELLEQLVSVPAYPWERIERGARARGESAAWEAWEARATSFLEARGLGRAVLVPMRAHDDAGVFRGAVVTDRGDRKRLAYSMKRGLWFRNEGDV